MNIFGRGKVEQQVALLNRLQVPKIDERELHTGNMKIIQRIVSIEPPVGEQAGITEPQVPLTNVQVIDPPEGFR